MRRENEIDFESREIEFQRILKEITADQRINELLQAMQSHDQITLKHLERSGVLMAMIAEKLGLSSFEKSELAQAALLHDIGKLETPREILQKEGSLTEEEEKIKEKHPVATWEILKEAGLDEIAEIAVGHHEEQQEKRYPRQKERRLKERRQDYRAEKSPRRKGERRQRSESTRKWARLVALIERTDALFHPRPYKKAWPLEKVQKELKKEFPHLQDEFIVLVVNTAQNLGRG